MTKVLVAYSSPNSGSRPRLFRRFARKVLTCSTDERISFSIRSSPKRAAKNRQVGTTSHEEYTLVEQGGTGHLSASGNRVASAQQSARRRREDIVHRGARQGCQRLHARGL